MFKCNGEIEMDPKKVTDALAGNMSCISSLRFCCQKFQNMKAVQDDHNLDFTANKQYNYNDLTNLINVCSIKIQQEHGTWRRLNTLLY